MSKSQYYICITPFFPSPNNWRGAYVLDQVKAIQRNSDHEVIVLMPTTLRNKSKSYEIDGITVHQFQTLQTPSYMFNGIFNRYNEKAFIKTVEALKIDLKHVRFVHTHTGPFAIYGLALKKIAPQIKVFVQHHDLDPFTIRNGKFAHWKPNAIYRAKNSLRLFNEVDLHICISNPCKDNLLAFPKVRKEEVFQSYIDALKSVANLPKAQPKNIYVLYNGVDTSLFNENEVQNHKLSHNNIFRIGCIANFQELKDHKCLVEAFRILVEKGYTDMRLSLLGTGETKPEIIKLLQNTITKPINSNAEKPQSLYELTEWPSEVSHEQLPDYYHSLDLFVLPSYFEGFGCVYSEAYACGVPFMGVYNQGAAEIISKEERDKWLIGPHDATHLAELIEHYYKERYKQILCKDYNIDKLIKEFLHYIDTNYGEEAPASKEQAPENSTKLKLSIIIPVYKVEQYLSKCLDSVLCQKLPDNEYEIIVVNDGSPDNSLAIANEYATNHSNIKVINQLNRGLSAARNTGLKHAQGEYVWFIDSDDWIKHNSISPLLEYAIANQLDVHSFGFQQVYENGSITPYDIKFEENGRIYDGASYISKVQMLAVAWAAIYRRKFLQENNLFFYEGILHEDQEFTPRAYFLAERIAHTNNIVYNYLQRSGSIMKSNHSAKRCKDLLSVADSLYSFTKANVEEGSDAFLIFKDRINFAFSQSLALYSKDLFDINVYRQKPYYPLQGKLGYKYHIINYSLTLYLAIYKIKKYLHPEGS